MSVRYVFFRRMRDREPGKLYAHGIADTRPPGAKSYRDYHYTGTHVYGVAVWLCYENGMPFDVNALGNSCSASTDMCDLLPMTEL